MRTPIIAGNWKMNMTITEALDLVKGIHFGLPQPGNVDVIVAPPFTAIERVSDFLKNSYITVAAQNMHFEESGAFTGEVSSRFIKEAGADYVIIGHSERRQYNSETDETVNKKIKSAFGHDLLPIICVGETLDERESNQIDAVIERQVRDGLSGITAEEAEKTVVAYEPVWAIGTGKTATPEEAEVVHLKIREILTDMFGTEVAKKMRILYGGSMKPSNCKELLNQPNIDGGLIGGASLKPEDFIELIKKAS